MADLLTPFFLKSMYQMACNTPSDIYEHLPILYELGNQCNHITEFGVGIGNSSTAFLASRSDAKVLSYDIRILPEAEFLFSEAKRLGRDAALINGNSLYIKRFEDTDLLFIDSLHTYYQLREELSLYNKQVRKWIVMHDTTLFGDKGEDGQVGLWEAIREFLEFHKKWELHSRVENNNGLTVLKRVAE